jgi:catechol 2,3-dioxygenase-like lactoylglutathione lyase family enzyme
MSDDPSPQAMIGHVSLGVNDLPRALAFYDTVFRPLNFVHVWEDAGGVGFSRPGGKEHFALFSRPGQVVVPGAGFHVAFVAPSQAAVDAFHAAALAAGGKDMGPPGLRPDYEPTYYAAFVTDLDGYKIEAFHL